MSEVDKTKKNELDAKLDLDKNPIKYATSQPGVTTTEPHDKHFMELTLRSGQHSDLVKRILRQRIEQRAADFPRWPAETSAGVRVMWLESRFFYDRERISEDFDNDWRRYRANYLHSLNLDPREPLHSSEYETSLINPIRRFLMKPGDWMEKNLIHRFITKEHHYSQLIRFCAAKSLMIYVGLLGGYYWIRYHHRSWESKDGPELFVTSPLIYPGDPLFPYKDPHTEPAHHHLRRFDQRKVFKDLRDYEDRTAF